MAKFVSALCFCLLGFASMAQPLDGRVVYPKKTHIQGPTKKSLGNLISIEGLHSYVFLLDCHQSRDSSGLYRTDFEFGNPNRIIAYNITIVLGFDEMIDTVIFTTDGEPKGLRTTFASNKSGASYQASELSPRGIITATIISKKRVFTSIAGTEGQLRMKL